jgi:prolyl oligopeptidase
VVLTEFDGTSQENGLLFARPEVAGEFTRLVPTGVAAHQFLAHHNGRLLIMTNLDAPNGRVVSIPLDDPDRRIEVVPEQSAPIEIAAAAANHLVLVVLDGGSHRVLLYHLDGTPDGEVDLPGPGTITELQGALREPTLFLGYQSFVQPPSALRWEAGKTTVFAQADPPLDPDRVVLERHRAVSDDGAEVGMFVLRRTDTAPPAPTELYGYGGFAINVTPIFDPARLAWLEAGGVVVTANLRGGAEQGEEWHRQGMLGNKQRVFDDFIACAEHLIEVGITTPGRLGIRGRSNGGLLTAAVLLQQPNLFGAVISQVPVTDMYRYQHFTAGRYWTVEYGDAEQDPEAFRWLSAYSPLHNVAPGAEYPPVLLMTAESDDRVVPMHALKFAATLQHAAGGRSENPLMVRVETRAGHGLGKPTSKLIDESADTFGFLLHHLS